ncbi:MAG: O-acetyl-ADP-ribose deacetylase [Saprospiraceae bacterium]|nr:O-acetyl-ADP-ribose deacetylase [Saprospiraceae bacterium]
MEFKLIQGDITKLIVDAIVNAANTSLLGGGGVDGAIHRKGGAEILEECRMIRQRQGGCAVGEAVMTTAGKLSAQKVIHTVGPVWNGGQSGEAQKLHNCYWNSLRLAEEAGFESIAFPNISTGIYRYPKEAAAKIALKAVQSYSYQSLQEVYFVCFDPENFSIYQDLREG